jgi:hypothetical protein
MFSAIGPTGFDVAPVSLLHESGDCMSEKSECAGANDDGKIPCPVCAEPISPAAHKCVHCDSYIDWRRFVFLGNTALALVIALVSVVTTAVTVYRATAAPPDSTLAFRYVGVVAGKPTFLASNPGTSTGVVGTGTLQIGTPSDGLFVPLAVENTEAGILLVEGGKVRQFALTPSGYPKSRNGRASSEELAAQQRCAINIQQFKHDNDNPISTFPTGCDELRSLIRLAAAIPE